ncbi:hypothetical protein CPC16_011901 [Podila verticillata]|nr:hypothetical protein CPC16_011901 [Podila verticillata]
MATADHSIQTMLPRSIAECVPLALATVMYLFNVTRYLIFDHPVRPSSPRIRKRCTAVSSSSHHGRSGSYSQQDPALVVIMFIFPWIVPQEPQSLLGRILGWYCRILWTLTEVVLEIGSIVLMIRADSKKTTTTTTTTTTTETMDEREVELGSEEEDVVMESLFDLDEDQTELESLCGHCDCSISEVCEVTPLDEEDQIIDSCAKEEGAAVEPCEEEKEAAVESFEEEDLVATHVMEETQDGAVRPCKTIECGSEDNAQEGEEEGYDCQIEHVSSEGEGLALAQIHSQVIDNLVYIHETCQEQDHDDISLGIWADYFGHNIHVKRPDTPRPCTSDSELEDATSTAPESEDDDDVHIEDSMVFIGDCVDAVTQSAAAEKKKKKKRKPKKKKSGCLVQDAPITLDTTPSTTTMTTPTKTRSVPRTVPALTTTSISTATKFLSTSPTTDNAFCWHQNGPQPQPHRRQYRRVPEPFEPMTVNIAAGIGSMDEQEWMLYGFHTKR